MDVKTVKEQDGTWFVLFCFVFFVVREKEKATTRLGWWTGRKKFGFYRVFFSCFRPSGFVRLTPRFSFFFPSTTSSWAHLSDSSSLSLSLSHTQTLLESRKRGQRTESWTPFSFPFFLFFYFFFAACGPSHPSPPAGRPFSGRFSSSWFDLCRGPFVGPVCEIDRNASRSIELDVGKKKRQVFTGCFA